MILFMETCYVLSWFIGTLINRLDLSRNHEGKFMINFGSVAKLFAKNQIFTVFQSLSVTPCLSPPPPFLVRTLSNGEKLEKSTILSMGSC